VKGYAQRDYELPREVIAFEIGRPVDVHLRRVDRGRLSEDERESDLIIGKDSVVKATPPTEVP